jgi:hypothetical protein
MNKNLEKRLYFLTFAKSTSPFFFNQNSSGTALCKIIFLLNFRQQVRFSVLKSCSKVAISRARAAQGELEEEALHSYATERKGFCFWVETLLRECPVRLSGEDALGGSWL